MTPPRRPEDVTEEEVERVYSALYQHQVYLTVSRSRLRAAIASGLLVPPPRERTQMEKDEEEWQHRRVSREAWRADHAAVFSDILSRLFPAAKACGVTY